MDLPPAHFVKDERQNRRLIVNGLICLIYFDIWGVGLTGFSRSLNIKLCDGRRLKDTDRDRRLQSCLFLKNEDLLLNQNIADLNS